MPPITARHTRRRALILVVVLAVAAPLAARADHFDGDASSGSFDPQYEVKVPNAVTNQPSDYTFRVTQSDHEDPVVRALFRAPGAWPFEQAMAAMKPAQRRDGNPAGSCDDAIDGLNNNKRSDAGFARAERVGTSFLSAHLDGISRTGAAGAKAQPTDTPVTWTGEHAFRSWDAATETARMCLLLRSTDARVLNLPDTDPSPDSDGIEGVTELVASYEVQRLTDGDDVWWQVPADLSGLAKDSTLQTLHASLIEFRNTYAGVTAGNWQRARPFARAPSIDGTYGFEGIFWTCPAADPSYRNCRSARGTPVRRTADIVVRLARSGAHPIPTLLEPLPFSIVDGEAPVNVRWRERADFETPVGYVVSVAEPGERDRARIWSRPFVSGAGSPCDGTGICALAVSFPLVTDSFQLLTAGKKYGVSVTAIFEDGHRSDGRCNDGTAAGTADHCAALVSHAPGWAGVEVFVSDHAWALRYRGVLSVNERATPSNDLLLVDPDGREVAFVLWNVGAAAAIYAGSDMRMVTDGESGTVAITGPGAPAWVLAGMFGPGGAVATLSLHTKSITVPRAVPSPAPTLSPVRTPVSVYSTRVFAGTRV